MGRHMGLLSKRDRILLIASAVIGIALVTWWWTSHVVEYTTSPTIRYKVMFDSEIERDAVVRYALPGGAIKTDSVRTPWSSEDMMFDEGDELSIWASVDTASVDDPLHCDLVSPQGTWSYTYIGDDPRICITTWELGRWPPNDSLLSDRSEASAGAEHDAAMLAEQAYGETRRLAR
jgi:hypothetical protein